MMIDGSTLKQTIEAGLDEHADELTLTLNKSLQDFSDGINQGRQYDLFCVMSQLILRADEEVGPIVADLMKAVTTEFEILDRRTFSHLGYFFDDYLKKDNALRYFEEKQNVLSQEGTNFKPVKRAEES